MLTAAATVVLIALLSTKALPTSRSFAIWLVLLTAIALRELVRSLDLRDEPKSGFEHALLQRSKPAAAASPFARMETEIELATAEAEHAHRRLFPLLRAAAAARLGMRHGIDLEHRPEAARQLLGESTWDLLRPNRPAPDDRHAPGPRRAEIAAVIADLESL